MEYIARDLEPGERGGGADGNTADILIV